MANKALHVEKIVSVDFDEINRLISPSSNSNIKSQSKRTALNFIYILISILIGAAIGITAFLLITTLYIDPSGNI
ncbi:MAG: hypothetical protein LBC33_02640 [Mycoplasmataceae bacterium]|nr:hypothetical protein [Mycoplasmataceae bacterium]